MPFVVGSPRSGTTLLRLMLDAHPDLAIPPETGFIVAVASLAGAQDRIPEQFFQAVTNFPPEASAWQDFGIAAAQFRAQLQVIEPFDASAGLRLFYSLYAARFGKRRWGDKTPVYSQQMKLVLELLPEARFVHLIRDGRDVAVSWREQWFSPGRDIGVLAGAWRDTVQTARRHGTACPHYLEVRYEDLLRDTERELRRICAFAELDYSPAMLRYHDRAPLRLQEHRARHRSDGSLVVSQAQRLQQQALTQQPPDLTRIGSGLRLLSRAERASFEHVAGEILRECGYTTGD
jgi:hypothetical protein